MNLYNQLHENIKFQMSNQELLNALIEFVNDNGPYKVIHCPSLAESMKVDNFINELKENPYQLNLI